MQRKGYAKILMSALESHAKEQGIRLLYLDTQAGDKAEYFYRAVGFTKSGEIPHFVINSAGEHKGTSVYYKLLT